MMKLMNAGYEIVAVEEYYKRHDGKREAIALGKMETSHGTFYVTWEAMVGQNENGFTTYDFYWGHYFDEDRLTAYMDYHKRLYDRYNEEKEEAEWNG